MTGSVFTSVEESLYNKAIHACTSMVASRHLKPCNCIFIIILLLLLLLLIISYYLQIPLLPWCNTKDRPWHIMPA